MVENTGSRRKAQGIGDTESAWKTWDPGGKYELSGTDQKRR